MTLAPLYQTGLSEGDYTLTQGKAWLAVGGFAIRIEKTDEGVAVDVYKNGREDEDAIASCYAFDHELEDREPQCTKNALIQGEPCNCFECVQDECGCDVCGNDEEE